MTTFQDPPPQSRRSARQSERGETPAAFGQFPAADESTPTPEVQPPFFQAEQPVVAPATSGRRARATPDQGLFEVPPEQLDAEPAAAVTPAAPIAAEPAPAEPLTYMTQGAPAPDYTAPVEPDPAPYRVRDFSPEGASGRRAATAPVELPIAEPTDLDYRTQGAPSYPAAPAAEAAYVPQAPAFSAPLGEPVAHQTMSRRELRQRQAEEEAAAAAALQTTPPASLLTAPPVAAPPVAAPVQLIPPLVEPPRTQPPVAEPPLAQSAPSLLTAPPPVVAPVEAQPTPSLQTAPPPAMPAPAAAAPDPALLTTPPVAATFTTPPVAATLTTPPVAATLTAPPVQPTITTPPQPVVLTTPPPATLSTPPERPAPTPSALSNAMAEFESLTRNGQLPPPSASQRVLDPDVAPAPAPMVVPAPPVADTITPTFIEPELEQTGGYTPPTGHWSRQADLDDETQPWENTITREVGGGNVATTTSALVLPAIPRPTDFPTALNGTGEILLTGSIDLPRSLGAVGGDSRQYDDPNVDYMFDTQDAEFSGTDSAPVRAIRAVSTHTSARGVIHANKPHGNRLLTVLFIAASAMAVGVVALLVAGLVFKIF